MGDYNTPIDSQQISGNSSIEGNKITVDDRDLLELQVEGDAESTDLDVRLQGKVGPAAPFGDYSTTDFTGQDLTTKTNNSKVYPFDVSGLSEVKPDIKNNTGDNTTVSVYTGTNTHN